MSLLSPMSFNPPPSTKLLHTWMESAAAVVGSRGLYVKEEYKAVVLELMLQGRLTATPYRAGWKVVATNSARPLR